MVPRERSLCDEDIDELSEDNIGLDEERAAAHLLVKAGEK